MMKTGFVCSAAKPRDSLLREDASGRFIALGKESRLLSFVQKVQRKKKKLRDKTNWVYTSSMEVLVLSLFFIASLSQ